MSEPAASSLETYAAVVAGIAAGRPREAMLEEHGLTEETFVAMERSIKAELSRAMAAPDVPPFIQAYEAAMRTAQTKALGASRISSEAFMRGLAAIQERGDPVKALERIGLEANDLVRSLARFREALAKDPALLARFERIRAKKKKP